MRLITTLLMACSISFYTAAATVNPFDCIKIDNAVGNDMYQIMLEDFKLKQESIDLSKTRIETISITPVTYKLALFYGEKERELAGKNSDDPTTAEEYAQGFMENKAKNIIVRYQFQNERGDENIVIASAFVSNQDCAVRFNGYITVKREF